MSVKSDSTAIHVARMCIDAANIVLVVNLPSTAWAIALMPAVATFATSSLSLFSRSSIVSFPSLLLTILIQCVVVEVELLLGPASHTIQRIRNGIQSGLKFPIGLGPPKHSLE